MTMTTTLLTGLGDEEGREALRRLAEVARTHDLATGALQLEVARSKAAGVTWTEIAETLKLPRHIVKDRFVDWAAFRRLRKERLDGKRTE